MLCHREFVKTFSFKPFFSNILMANSIYDILYQADSLKFGDFTFSYGKKTPVYFAYSSLFVNPRHFDLVTDMLADKARELNPDKIAGAFTSGIPIATAISMKTNIPMVYIRPRAKEHGLKTRIEGEIREGETVLFVDDVLSEAALNIEFISYIRDAGGIVKDMLVILNYGKQLFAEMNKAHVNLHSLISARDLAMNLVKRGRLKAEQYEKIKELI